MKMKSIFRCKDFFAGLLLVFFGIAAIWLGRDYPMGNLRKMGPGYFPAIIGGALAMLGLIVSARSLFITSESVRFPTLRPLIMILSAVVGFALSVEKLGLAVSILILILVSCLARQGFRLRETALLYIGLLVLTILIFVYALGLNFKIWLL